MRAVGNASLTTSARPLCAHLGRPRESDADPESGHSTDYDLAYKFSSKSVAIWRPAENVPLRLDTRSAQPAPALSFAWRDAACVSLAGPEHTGIHPAQRSNGSQPLSYPTLPRRRRTAVKDARREIGLKTVVAGADSKGQIGPACSARSSARLIRPREAGRLDSPRRSMRLMRLQPGQFVSPETILVATHPPARPKAA